VQQLSEDDLTEIFYIREALEGLAARLAATTRRRARLPNCVLWLKTCSLRSASRNCCAVSQANSIVVSHKPPTIGGSRQSLKALQDQVRQVQHSTLYLDDRPAIALDEHKSLVQAIERRNGDQAEQVARAHRRRP